eukprot:scaffold14029_cov46-Phaeocystis_antarctica.AAC.1
MGTAHASARLSGVGCGRQRAQHPSAPLQRPWRKPRATRTCCQGRSPPSAWARRRRWPAARRPTARWLASRRPQTRR